MELTESCLTDVTPGSADFKRTTWEIARCTFLLVTPPPTRLVTTSNVVVTSTKSPGLNTDAEVETIAPSSRIRPSCNLEPTNQSEEIWLNHPDGSSPASSMFRLRSALP